MGYALLHADGKNGRKDGHDKANSCYWLCDASETESENKKGLGGRGVKRREKQKQMHKVGPEIILMKLA